MTHSTQVVQQAIDVYKDASKKAEMHIDTAISELNAFAGFLPHGSLAKQTVLNQVMTLISAKTSLMVREPVVI